MLERCRSFAESRRRLKPDCGSEWIECGGAWAVFDGVGSPVTQSFGLGVFEEITPAILDQLEKFFHDRGALVHHEVSPLVGVEGLSLLCARGYHPIEVSSVLYRPVINEPAFNDSRIRVRFVGADEADTWCRVSTEGWASELPDLLDFMQEMGEIIAGRENGMNFLAEFDGVPGAAGTLIIHEGVALFGGSATIPSMRRQGLQAALLQARMRLAADRGCDLAMMVAAAGSGSQRNAERQGFRIAYTRNKWQLDSPTK